MFAISKKDYCCLLFLSEVLFIECPISCCFEASVNSFSFACLLGLDVQMFYTVEKKKMLTTFA